MTYEQARDILHVIWKTGSREIDVTPALYDAYVDGLMAIDRVGGPPLEPGYPRFVWFKTMKVYNPRDAHHIPPSPAASPDTPHPSD